MTYYISMVFRNNHHRYVLCDGSDELHDIRVPDLLEHRQLVPERVSAANKRNMIFYLSEINSLVTLE